MNEKFRQDLAKFVKDTGQKLNAVKKATAILALKKVVVRSPVWTGAYVKSHRVGIGALDTSQVGGGFDLLSETIALTMEEVGFNFPPKISEAEAQAARKNTIAQGVAKIKRANIEEAIFVSNSKRYADQIEYLGWEIGKTKRPPYHVYGLTTAEIQVQFPLIVSSGMRTNILGTLDYEDEVIPE